MSFQIGGDGRLLAKRSAAHSLTGFADDHSGSVAVPDEVALGAFGSSESVTQSLARLHLLVSDARPDQELAAPDRREEPEQPVCKDP